MSPFRPPAGPASAGRILRLGLLLAAGMLGLGLAAAPAREAGGQAPAGSIPVLEVKGPIGVGAADFIARELETAAAAQAPAVVIRLDTPGGLLSATRDIVDDILASTVPVIVHVAPSGARAASAGTFILYAAHIAAMAPATHVGAATPVSLGGPPGTPSPSEKPRDDKPAEPASAGERKAINDAAAYIRTLAQLRGRNAEFAEAAVRSAATMTAREALDAKVIEIVAADTAGLLAQSHGRTVRIAGEEHTLQTRDAPSHAVAPDWRARLISILTDPNVAYILLLIGFYGIVFEFWNPGFIFPGVLGGISLLLALAALSVMPVSYAGLALIILGLMLMAAEAFTPGVGVLGIGGLVAFVAGSIFLFDPGTLPSDIELGIAWPVIAGATAATAGFFGLVIGFALRSRRRPVVTGAEQLVGSTARVLDWSGFEGHVYVHGERWHARSATPLPAGAKVRILGIDGLTLLVEPAPPPPALPQRSSP